MKVGIIGAGTMGAGIAQAFAMTDGYEVCLCDIKQEFADGGKNRGMERMLHHYGLTRSQSIAFGDGGNDIDMLRYAGLGVAMGNATDETKQAADYVTGSVDDGGIAQALRHFGVL